MTITRQWQIYIPESVREALKITKPSRIKAEIKGKSLVLTPQESPVLKLAGKYKHLKPKKPINLDRIRDYIDYSQL